MSSGGACHVTAAVIASIDGETLVQFEEREWDRVSCSYSYLHVRFHHNLGRKPVENQRRRPTGQNRAGERLGRSRPTKDGT